MPFLLEHQKSLVHPEPSFSPRNLFKAVRTPTDLVREMC